MNSLKDDLIYKPIPSCSRRGIDCLYHPLEGVYGIDIFTQEERDADFAGAYKAAKHMWEYVFTDAKNERKFVEELDTAAEVVVYSQLPRGFGTPTPMGNYNPDWAIAFKQDKVKHVFSIAETKGSMSSIELRAIKECRIACARRFYRDISSADVKYEVVYSYAKLRSLVS
jgi:type III restriction enzyme